MVKPHTKNLFLELNDHIHIDFVIQHIILFALINLKIGSCFKWLFHFLLAILYVFF